MLDQAHRYFDSQVAIVLDERHHHIGQVRGAVFNRLNLEQLWRYAAYERDRNRKTRSQPWCRVHVQFVTKKVRKTLDNGQTQTEPLFTIPLGIIDLDIAFEDIRLSTFRDTDPVVPDTYLYEVAPPLATQQNMPLPTSLFGRRVTDRIGHHISDDPIQRMSIRMGQIGPAMES